MQPYPDLPEDEQVELLRGAARSAADRFGLGPVELSLVIHAYNTTFRADLADGRTVAVRVNTNSQSTPANIRAQLAWTHALRVEAGLLVPDPQLTPDGEPFVTELVDGLGPVIVVVNSWLEGDDVGVGATPAVIATELGRTMAALHDHAESWTMPPGATLPTFDTPLFGDENLIGSALTGPDAAVIAAAFERSGAAFARLADRPTIALHADLHGGNLKWHDGRLSVFDFDDAGLGVPELALAIALFYLREPDDPAEAALLDGYASRRPLPHELFDVADDLMAARQLLLANSLLLSSTASVRAEAEEYLGVTVERLRRWLDTGRFSRS